MGLGLSDYARDIHQLVGATGSPCTCNKSLDFKGNASAVKYSCLRVQITDSIDIQIALMVLSAAGFGMPTAWEESDSAESQRSTSFQKTLGDALDDLPWKFVLPNFVWGSEAERENVTVAGWIGKGWLGKRAKQAAVTFSSLEACFVCNQSRHASLTSQHRS